MTKFLIVCKANVCRSPMALTIARQLTIRAGLANQLQFDSAGTHSARPSQKPDARTIAALKKRGYLPGSTRSRSIDAKDFQDFDVILAMDADNLQALQKVCPTVLQHKLRLFLSFATDTTLNEVPDPYYGTAAGFDRVLDLCESGIKALLRQRQL